MKMVNLDVKCILIVVTTKIKKERKKSKRKKQLNTKEDSNSGNVRQKS